MRSIAATVVGQSPARAAGTASHQSPAVRLPAAGAGSAPRSNECCEPVDVTRPMAIWKRLVSKRVSRQPSASRNGPTRA
jgi:hypothetical protein